MNAESLTETAVESHDRRKWYALALIVAAQFMVVLDVAIVNVALPSIKDDLNFSQESLQWVITGYSIMFGGFLMLGGRLADLLGRRRLFVAGLAMFTVASLLDGLAWSEGSLIAFRLLQGLGAAMLSPAALSILTTTFTEGKERNLALGIWGAASGSGGAAGVLLGGALTSAPQLVVDLLHQRAGRHPRDVADAVPAQGEQGRSGASPLRLRRRRVDHRRADAPGLRDDAGGPARLGHDRVDRPARDLGRSARRVRRDRDALEGAAAAAADLQAADAVGLERERPADGRGDLRPVLPADALHAAGPALLGDQDRCRLHRPDADDHRVLGASPRRS